MNEAKKVSDVLPTTDGNVVSFPSGSVTTSEVAERITNDLIIENRRRYALDYYERKCPPAYRATDWNHPSLVPNLEPIQVVLDWQFGARGLLLSGVARTGKTRAVWGLLKRLLVEEGRRVAYFHAQDLAGRIAREISFGRDEAGDFIDSIAEIEILVVDDLGQEGVLAGQDDRVRSWLLRLVDRRLADMRPLIVTTNAGAAGIARGFSDRSRLREEPLIGRLVEICQVVRFTEPV